MPSLQHLERMRQLTLAQLKVHAHRPDKVESLQARLAALDERIAEQQPRDPYRD
jgi:hypothetical protein